jgi:MoaA/NifB/PqqE/SkfB family radical SAM enzyme
MDFETAWKAVSLFLQGNSNFGRRRIKFFGGEPLLCFELIKKTVEKVNALGEKAVFRLPTNGVLINKKVVKFLNDNPNVELVVSARNINILEKKKKLMQEILNLPEVTVNLNILPKKIEESGKKFVELEKKGFSRFNFLPAYFTIWERGEIALLKKNLEKIAKIIKSSRGKIQVSNLEVESAVPLFNLAPTVDPNGDIMAGNFFLDENFFRWREELKIGNVKNLKKWDRIPKLSFNFYFLLEKTFSKEVINSNIAVDRELNRFVNRLRAA